MRHSFVVASRTVYRHTVGRQLVTTGESSSGDWNGRPDAAYALKSISFRSAKTMNETVINLLFWGGLLLLIWKKPKTRIYAAYVLLGISVVALYGNFTSPDVRYATATVCDGPHAEYGCIPNQSVQLTDAALMRRGAVITAMCLLAVFLVICQRKALPSRLFWGTLVVWVMFAAFLQYQSHYQTVYRDIHAQAESRQPGPQPSRQMQAAQAATVVVWTRPDGSPATTHTEMYPQEDSVLYLTYKSSVAFSGFDTALAMQTGQYSVVNSGGFPTRYNPTSAYVLYDVNNGWSRYSELPIVGNTIVQHFCHVEHMAVYEAVDPRIEDNLKGQDPANMVSVCGRAIDEASSPASTPTPLVEVTASASEMPLQNGELVGRSDSLKLTKKGIVLQRVSAENDDGEIVQVPNQTLTLQEWLATQSGRIVYLFKSQVGKGQAYEDLSSEQKSLIQDFCQQGLQVYQVVDSDDHPKSVCER
jgi:hypothetical protein